MMLQAVQDTFLGVLRPSRERFDENLPLQIASLAFLKEEVIHLQTGYLMSASVVEETKEGFRFACRHLFHKNSLYV